MFEEIAQDPTLDDFLRRSRSRDAINEVLNARDNFLIASSKFIEYRCIQIISGGNANAHGAIHVGGAVEDTIFEIPSQPFPVYQKIFARLPHVKNRCAIARHAQLANAVNAVATATGRTPRPLRDEIDGDLEPGMHRSFVRDVGLEQIRGHSAFIDFIEAFVQLATSCKEARDDGH